MNDSAKTISAFVADWPDSSANCRRAFLELMEYIRGCDGTRLEFYARPGVTYSLRGVHPNQSKEPLYVMVDVIEDEPRWLSVCFYGGMVTDPDGRGDLVPGGLLGEDGLCFDLEDGLQEQIDYLRTRINEAHAAVIRN